MAKEKQIEKELLVVNELPTQELREITGEDGTVYEVVTAQEAIKELLVKVRDIHKAV